MNRETHDWNHRGVTRTPDRIPRVDEIRQYLEDMAELRTKTINGMVTVLESCQQIFTSLMEKGLTEQAKDPANPNIPKTLEHLAILNDQIKTALDDAKKLF